MKNNFSELIIDKFTAKFTSAYKSLRGSGKTKIIKYSPIIFKRWYYSALVNETTLSPSFIYNAGIGDGPDIFAPSVTPTMSGTHFRDFNVKENHYSLKSHPVVKDLTCLVNFCAPDVELDENDFINAESSQKLISLLSISDPFYVEYLTGIAFSLKLIKKSAAIYSNKATVIDNYSSFLDLNQEEALKKIVDATVKQCSKNITSALPHRLPIVSERGIIKLIKNPISVDEIFKRIFSSFGVDIDHVWDSYDKTNTIINENESAILTSAFFLGVLLDKWFITPFGEYLKIIEPVYCFCYNFDNELNYLFDVIKANGNVSSALFSPCAFYSITQFGKLLLAADTTGIERQSSSVIPMTNLLDLLRLDEAVPAENSFDSDAKVTKSIYSFKVKLMRDKRYWKQIDVADYNTLHELHLEIALDFGFGFSNYLFYTNESLSPFCKITAPEMKGKHRKADKVMIFELSLIKGNKMIYVSDSGGKLELELVKCLPVCSKGQFPQTVKQSRLMSELEY